MRTDSGIQIVSMKNVTTETDLLKGSGPLDVLEFGDAMVFFSFPVPMQKNALLSLQCVLLIQARPTHFFATTKVISCERSDQGIYRVQLQLRQYDSEVWSRFVGSRRHKQTRADRLFSRIKGWRW